METQYRKGLFLAGLLGFVLVLAGVQGWTAVQPIQPNPLTTNLPPEMTNVVKAIAGATQQKEQTTNYIYAGTNYYYYDQRIYNEFTTNLFLDQQVSNYFKTEVFQYNTYTNLSITNYVSQDTYVSNTVINYITTNVDASQYFSTNVTLAYTNVYTNIIGGAYIANDGGRGTNTELYGDTTFRNSGSPGRIDIYDAAGITLIAGFDTNRGGWWGPGIGNVLVSIITNLFSTNITAMTIIVNTNVFNVSRGGTVITTNLFFDNAAATAFTWAGPTNSLNYTNGTEQGYATLVPVNVTNVLGEVSGYDNQILQSVTNKASTNITWLVPSSYFIAAGDTYPFTLTNGNIGQVWYKSMNGMKTVIFQQFKTQ